MNTPATRSEHYTMPAAPTVAPWSVQESAFSHGEHGEFHVIDGGTTPRTVAVVYFERNAPGAREQAECNAHFIANAPAFAASLSLLLSRCASLDQSATHDGLKNCEAIAKARATLERCA